MAGIDQLQKVRCN